jgi:hypothetical protein
MLAAFLDEPDLAPQPSLERVVASGEALPGPLVERFLEDLPAVALHNLYGPTEAAVDVTAWPCEGPGTPPIGRPIANLRLHLLDRRGHAVPTGVPGELHIGGQGLARGYLGQPARTAAAFVPDPFAHNPGERLYKTGDLARWRPDGALHYLGRRDHQVKVRGFRVELGEVESTLRRHPTVTDAVAAVHRGDGAGGLLVAWAATTAPGEALRAFLAEHLPAHMVPARIVSLPELPQTAHGKIHRRALPDPLAARPATVHRAPRTPTERRLAAVWAEVLGRDEVGTEESFFDLGGHSLLLLRVHHRLRADGDPAFDFPLRKAFEHPTVGSLAAWIDRRRTPAPGPPEGAAAARLEGARRGARRRIRRPRPQRRGEP